MCRCFCNCKILHARPCCVFVCCTLLVICIGVGFAVVHFWPEISGGSGTKTWTCYRSSCRRCEVVEDPSIHLNATMCANITYISEDDGFFYIVTVNKSVIANETLTDLNPPAVCIEEQDLEPQAKACIRLYNIYANHTNMHVCAEVEATKKLHIIKKYEFGCFDIKPLKEIARKPTILDENSERTVLVT